MQRFASRLISSSDQTPHRLRCRGRLQAKAEAAANKLLRAADNHSDNGRFSEARESAQKARTILRKANVGQTETERQIELEPTFRRVELRIEEEEAAWTRKSGDEALDKAEALYNEHRYA
eukprot:376374-Rhodomonas_salina.2